MLTATDVSWRATNASAQALRLLQGATTASDSLSGVEPSIADTISLSARAQTLLAALADPAGLAVFAATDDADTGWMTASAGTAGAGLSILTATPEAVSATAGAAADTDGAAEARAEIVNGGGDARLRAYAIVANRGAGQLRIASGDGNDSIAGVTSGSLAIEAGGGDNQVAAGFGAIGDIAVGNGRNSLALRGAFGMVTAGDGGNAIAASGAGSIVTTGAGDDSIDGAQWVDAGAGDDRIILGNADLSSIVWRPGAGRDEITLAPAEAGTRATASRAIIGDGSGAFEAQAIGVAPQDTLRLAVPSGEEAGAGTAHAAIYLQGIDQSEVSASLSGTDLTLSLATTGETLTLHGYSAGRVTFVFDTRDRGGGLSATREPPGLA